MVVFHSSPVQPYHCWKEGRVHMASHHPRWKFDAAGRGSFWRLLAMGQELVAFCRVSLKGDMGVLLLKGYPLWWLQREKQKGKSARVVEGN